MSLNQDQKHEIRNALISIWAYARHLEEQEKLIIRQQLKRIEEALNRMEMPRMKTETQVLLVIFFLTVLAQFTIGNAQDITNIVVGGLLGYLTKDNQQNQ